MGEKMRILRNLCITSLFMFLVFGTAGAFAQGIDSFSQTGGEQGGAPPDSGQLEGFGPMQGQGNGPQGPRTPKGPMGYCSDSQYLYVIENGAISQYNLADLTLEASVDLPEPEVEEPDPSEELADPSEELANPPEEGAPSRRGGGPSGAFIEGSFLYILHHGAIFQYTVPELVLQNTVVPEPAE